MSGLKRILSRLHDEAAQSVVLTKHFFLRLFHNDVVAFEEQMEERVIGILAVLAVFCGLLAYGFVSKYQWQPDLGHSWVEKAGIMTFFMLVMGIVAVLEWEVIFPDSRDFTNLSPLPLRPRTILAAKFGSLCLFVGLFALSMNLLSAPFFLIILPRWHSTSPLYALSFAGVHFLSMFLAIFFAFFFNVLIISLFATVFGYRLFHKISVYIRALLLLAHALLLLVYLKGLFVGLEYVLPLDRIRAGAFSLRSFARVFPPLWFTDLYETLAGNANLPFHGRYKDALAGLALMIAVFFLTAGLGFRSFLAKMGHEERPKNPLKRIGAFAAGVFDGLFLRNPIQRAVFHFYAKTLRASMFHKMRLATFITIGMGLIPFQLAIRDLTSKAYLTVNRGMLASSLIISFFVVLGVRGIVHMPVLLEGNWIFQMTEEKDIRPYATGLRKGLIILNLAPLFAGLFCVFAYLWDVRTAAFHCLYGFVLSTLLLELLFLRWCKIPFACSYLPGKEKIQLFWLIYLLLFIAYINLMSWIELEVFRDRESFFWFYGTGAAIFAGVRLYQRLFFYKRVSIRYEEEPPPVMIGLDYETPKHLRKANS